jgi:hypothetical protein
MKVLTMNDQDHLEPHEGSRQEEQHSGDDAQAVSMDTAQANDSRGVPIVGVQGAQPADSRGAGQAGRAEAGAHPQSDHGNPPARDQADDEGGRNSENTGRKPDEPQQDEDQGQAGDDRPTPAHSPRELSPTKRLFVAAGGSIVAGVIAAMAYSHFFGSNAEKSSAKQFKAEAASNHSNKNGRDTGGNSQAESGAELISDVPSAKSVPGFTPAADSNTLKKQIIDLMHRVDALAERIDRMAQPKDQTPPVLHTLQLKVADLSKELGQVASVPAQVRHLNSRFDVVAQDLKTLRSQMEVIQGGQTSGSKSDLTETPAPRPETKDGIEKQSPTMQLGISLLEHGQYVQAREMFLRLELSIPKDARVWYLAALAEGLTSGRWDGEAQRLAEKGIERERAGTPSTAQIDAALATTTPIRGQKWLASLRQRILGADRH